MASGRSSHPCRRLCDLFNGNGAQRKNSRTRGFRKQLLGHRRRALRDIQCSLGFTQRPGCRVLVRFQLGGPHRRSRSIRRGQGNFSVSEKWLFLAITCRALEPTGLVLELACPAPDKSLQRNLKPVRALLSQRGCPRVSVGKLRGPKQSPGPKEFCPAGVEADAPVEGSFTQVSRSGPTRNLKKIFTPNSFSTGRSGIPISPGKSAQIGPSHKRKASFTSKGKSWVTY